MVRRGERGSGLEEAAEVCGSVGVAGLGDGGQLLLSASIRKPRGDMGAG